MKIRNFASSNFRLLETKKNGRNSLPVFTDIPAPLMATTFCFFCKSDLKAETATASSPLSGGLTLIVWETFEVQGEWTSSILYLEKISPLDLVFDSVDSFWQCCISACLRIRFDPVRLQCAQAQIDSYKERERDRPSHLTQGEEDGIYISSPKYARPVPPIEFTTPGQTPNV